MARPSNKFTPAMGTLLIANIAATQKRRAPEVHMLGFRRGPHRIMVFEVTLCKRKFWAGGEGIDGRHLQTRRRRGFERKKLRLWRKIQFDPMTGDADLGCARSRTIQLRLHYSWK